MIKIDNHIAHNARVNRASPVGTFCAVPIVTLDELGMDADVLRDLAMRLRFSTGTSVPAEVMPGEELCSDHIIRRKTTAEAVGYDAYHNQEFTEEGMRRISIADARQASNEGAIIYWRPNRNTEYALISAEN